MSRHVFRPITPRVAWLSPDPATDRPVLGAIAGHHATLLVDAGNSPDHAQTLLRELARAALPPPRYVALTHWHWDHVFGAAELGLPALCHHETQRIVAELARLDWSDEALDRRVETGEEIAFCRDMIKAELPDRAGLELRPPELGFSGSVALDLGGLTCHLEHVGGDHAHDSIVVYVPQERVVFLGDCLYMAIYGGPRRYTTRLLFPLLERLLSYDAECYLAGHHAQPLSRADLVAEAALLTTIGRAVDARGDDREAVLADLRQALGDPLDADQLSIVEEFLAGLRQA
jgi:glyoxylase-like metal-dependent hydrolase (beta-lactamase superfamily II)